MHLTRLRPAGRLAVATVLIDVLVTGCGGSSHSPTTATANRTTITASSATAAGSSPGPAQFHQEELAFAECMRSSGVPSFPDPKPGGGFSFHAPASAPAFQAAQAKCRKLLPNAGAGPPFDPQALVQLRQIASCMRRHGVADFPDPKRAPATGASGLPPGVGRVTDYRGVLLEFPATLDTRSPAFEQAAISCGGAFLDRR